MTSGIHPTIPPENRCPACGQPIDQPDPDEPIDSCPLCSHKFSDSRTTGKDVTPYAIAFQKDQAKIFAMSKWIWAAGPERLKHLAMMRASQASRRFATIHFVLLAFALGLVRATWLGWRAVSHAQASTGTVSKPAGQGWFRVTAFTPVPGNESATELTGIWWNPAQAILGGAIALVAAFILIAIMRFLIRFAVEFAHAKQYRKEHRMTAAQCYATAWLTPIILAAIALCFQATTVSTSAAPAELLFLVPAGILAGIGIIFGWFWTLRLASTSPVDTRTPVTIMLALVAPTIAIASASLWWLGLEKLYPPLFDALQMSF